MQFIEPTDEQTFCRALIESYDEAARKVGTIEVRTSESSQKCQELVIRISEQLCKHLRKQLFFPCGKFRGNSIGIFVPG